MRKKRPHVATLDEVRISRDGEDAIIEFIDATIATTHLKLEIKKELPMRLQEWEATIQEITVECTHDQKGAIKVLIAWRAKLEKEPNLLQPFQIDKIVREVRQRLNTDSR
ncbi:MAG TPA: hypothetical protein QF564_26525 [Pirellulaceae bacterium]|jgi:hypothetical protein|nr:hypothetical protein [Pirellulaceae bacterium]